MKLQHLAVIFVIIIMPISIVMSAYIGNQINAINLQNSYDANLINATYDAVKAFQLNTTNNKYASISNSKIRDIEASVNVFYNSLNTSMSGYSLAAKDLEDYVPAMLFTLYDGYYIYTSYDNVYSTTEADKKVDEKVKINLDGKNYQNGLKPYVYYSAQYKLRNGNIIVVNYTLDNEITVYADFGDGYTTRSGYLINPGYINESDINVEEKKLLYGKSGNKVEIGPEVLTEHLVTIEERESGGTGTDSGDYNYIFYQNKKIYQETNQDVINEIGSEYFWYDNYIKTPVNDPNIIADLNENKQKYGNGNTIMSTSAFDYYYTAWNFSNWVKSNLGDIRQGDMIRDENGILTTIGTNTDYLAENTGTEEIFNFNENNDPMLSSSTFNNHRLAVIRKTIETSLNTVISNYRSTQLYDYAMPVMTDDDWYRITNNVSMVTFMQGMSIGYRYYNNYAIITNNVNKEVIKPENVYIITQEKGSTNREYHQPGCKELLEGLKNDTLEIVGAYPTASFQRQSVKLTENSDDDVHFYLQSRGKQTGGGNTQDLITITGCYNCIVSSTTNYDTDEIIAGRSLINFQDRVENGGTGKIAFSNNSDEYLEVRKAYLQALARERYDLYKSNFDLEEI